MPRPPPASSRAPPLPQPSVAWAGVLVAGQHGKDKRGGGVSLRGCDVPPHPPPPVVAMAYQNAYRNGHAEGDPGGLLLTFRPCRPHPLRPNPTLRHKKDRVREREREREREC